ncbi:helix-turn-helix domain-containing protein [Paenibacillus yanchengensis]|uniref:Helix-turn-helix domain-containing protein n=1 Tax=Paenibacillus yanchengensis TaxID=2035833 RepID=A0ABW4YH01_9BACL
MSWRIIELDANRFFDPHFDIFINREVESFALLQHTHNFIEISYVEEGRGYHYIEDQMIPVKRGDIFIIPLGTSHVFRPTSTDKPLVIYNCIFRTSLLDKLKDVINSKTHLYRMLYKPSSTTPKWLHLTDEYDKALTIVYNMYWEFLKREPGYEYMITGQLIQLVALMQRYETHRKQEEIPNDRLDEAIQYINEHFSQNIKVQAVAERTFMSPSHFQRRFKKITGVTFVNYLQNIRIQRCCELLKTTQISIQQVANQVGYQDMKFFHALFRKKIGVTPRQYRLHAQQEVAEEVQ